MHKEKRMVVLQPFIDDGLVADELQVDKSGKEATVYCCRTGGPGGGELLAVKVYRPLAQRRFKNDAVYQSGRVITDARLRRAFSKKSRMGRGVQFASWVGHEYETLRILHALGADVPRPVAQSGDAILMEYVGDFDTPAPTLRQASVPQEDAPRLFQQILRNVELFLAGNRVHADLSAFNILYWRGAIRIIDFPQAVDPRENPRAFELLIRDVRNVCDCFRRHGVAADPLDIAQRMWRRYVRGEL
ncbi:MAG TPA: RIO1 family regulatory kinase/ATPase [Phycisphaerae bacterium]|nr:RIO1 family regulatory kinase/ATPase [Phycisphaerae bacterium]